jgi:plasmid maintenance system antidote protein VapI
MTFSASASPSLLRWPCASARLLGNGPTLWLNLQRAYDLEQAEKELADVLEKIPTVEAA